MNNKTPLKYLIGVVFAICCVYFLLKAITQDPIRVLITAPDSYAQRFEKSFTGSVIQPISCPFIQTNLIADLKPLEQRLLNLEEDDYIVFSSRKAIEALDTIVKRDPEVKDRLRTTKLSAIGKDIEYLREVIGGGQTVIVPEEPSPAGIAQQLAEDKDVAGKKVLVFIPRVEEMDEPYVVPDFIRRLEKIGLVVERCEVYTTRPSDTDFRTQAVQLIEEQKINCIAFTSSAEVDVFLQSFSEVPPNLTIACFGPYTTKFAEEHGLMVDVTATDFSSFHGFVEAIEAYLKSKK